MIVRDNEERRHRSIDPARIAGVSAIVFDDPQRRGVRALQVRNAIGLGLTLIPERGLDASELLYGGMPLTWYGPGNTAPSSNLDPSVDAFNRTFFGGLVATCELDAFGDSPTAAIDDRLRGGSALSVAYRPAQLPGNCSDVRGRAAAAADRVKSAITNCVFPSARHIEVSKFMALEHYDVIIIGSGAGGGTLVQTLAASGKRILLLERGNFLPRELENWDPKAVFVENRYVSKETWLDADGKAFQPQIHYFVGGTTKVYGAALYRLRPADFGEVRHVDGISPAWPLTYDEFEPYYTKAEWLYQVHGNRGEDPTEGHASRPYPWPAVSHEPRMAQLFADLQSGGYHPFHAPCGILLDEADRPNSACVRCKWCDGYPCLVHAKSDAEVLAVRPSLAYSNVTLLVNAEVTALETDGAGRRVTGVVVERNGKREAYEADIVVIAAGAANSAKLLLRSANDRHPNGLANGSDQVGRNYVFHNSSAIMAISIEKNPTVYQKTVGLNDFYFGEPDFAFPMGNIQMVGKSLPPMYRGERPIETALAPEFTLDQLSEHAVDFWLTTEDLPLHENRVTVDRDGTIRLAYRKTNIEEFKRLKSRLESLLGHIGMRAHNMLERNFYLSQDNSLAGVAHQAGTARFGNDPKTSVLDRNCKAHELDNLYVVDTSFFPSIGAVNPALTAMANAMRVGDHLLDRMG